MDNDESRRILTVDGEEVPLKTGAERKAELEAAKAELDKQLASGEISGAEYNQKLIDLMAPEQFKPRPPKKRWVGALIVLLLIIAIAAIPTAIFVNWRYYLKTTLTLNGVPDYSKSVRSSVDTDPIQIDFEEPISETGEYKGKPIIITYKAYYDITGVVTSIKDYWGFSAYNTLAPRDICMIWGDLAARYPSAGMEFYHGERYCVAKGPDITNYSEMKSKKGAFGSTHYGSSLISNNHLIPSSAEVRDEFLSFGVGDIVRIVGYLVRVNYDGIALDSSMTRDDVMFDSDSGTCEIIYVTRAEKVGKK